MSPAELEQMRKKRGLALSIARRGLKVTKAAFSKKTGLSRPTIDRIENGAGSWTIETELIYLSGLKLNQ